MRRYFVPPFFGLWDARVHSLELPSERWEESVKSQHLENREQMVRGLEAEYGTVRFEARLKNFQDIGDSPMSIVSYHNLFFHQARQAFVVEAYYPALTGACALGERILNHLVLDLRDHYRARSTYKEVHAKQSMDDWERAISVLEDWQVLEPRVAEDFRKLKKLRHKSLHFDSGTYSRVREDALEALQILREIIREQFGGLGAQRWFISGTKGAFFIKKDFERDPFVMTFYLKQCPCVGYRYTLQLVNGDAWILFDLAEYESKSISDEEFRDLYNNRGLKDLVPSDVPASPGIVTWLLVPGEASRVTLVAKEASQER